MATIRAYTTIEQSRKLAEILPIESADMYYREWKRMTKEIRNYPYCGRKMKPEYQKFGVMWECKCGTVIWEIN